MTLVVLEFCFKIELLRICKNMTGGEVKFAVDPTWSVERIIAKIHGEHPEWPVECIR